jgi:hypothetical protein
MTTPDTATVDIEVGAVDKELAAKAGAKTAAKAEPKAKASEGKMDPSAREMMEAGNVAISIEVQGVKYSIRSLTMNDRIMVQDRFDVGSYSDLDIGDMHVQRYIVWTLMVRTNEDLTEEQVGDMFDAENQDDWDYMMYLSSFKGTHADMEALAVKNARAARMVELQDSLKITSEVLKTEPSSTS